MFRTLKLTEEEYRWANDHDIGYCRACGSSHTDCEPDARDYECTNCGVFEVCGVEELLLIGAIKFLE